MIALVWFVVLGLPAALLLDRDANWRRLLGSAFLLGTGIVALILLAMSMMGIAWTLVSVTIACSVVVLALGPPASRRLGRRRPAAVAVSETLPAQPARTPAVQALLFDAITLLLIFAHGVFATLAPIGVWDFWAIWGLKARVFLAHGGIDWAFLEHPLHVFAHADYPLLLPLDYVFVALHHGSWDDRQLGILTTLFGAALLLIVRDCFEEELPPMAAALATLGLAPIALTQWIGIAEAPMIAFGGAALLMLRRGSFALGSVLLGFAAMTKNEGMALLVATAMAMALSSRRRELVRLWPAIAIACPWLVLRAMHALPTDLATGAVAQRAARHVLEVFRVLITTPLDRPILWIVILGTLALFAKELPRERFLLIAVLLQILFYVGAYVVSPNDVQWHVASSWTRIVEHVAVPLAFVAFLRYFWVRGGNLWTVVVGSGTNRHRTAEIGQRGSTRRGTQRTHGAQPREDRRKGPAQGPGEFPQDH